MADADAEATHKFNVITKSFIICLMKLNWPICNIYK